MNWRQNWDKILTVALGTVLGAGFGFFTALITVNNKISGVSERVAILEERSKTMVQKITAERMTDRIKELEDDTTLYQTIYTFLSEQLEEAREDTLTVLEEFIEKHRRE